MPILPLSQLLDSQENFPLAYIDFISSSLEFSVSMVFFDGSRPLLFERFTVQCMNLVKAIVKCENYKLRTGPDEEPDPVAEKAEKVREIIF